MRKQLIQPGNGRNQIMSRAFELESIKHCVSVLAVVFIFVVAFIRKMSLVYESSEPEMKRTNPSSTRAVETERKPTIESVHKNVELGNTYRMELLKQSLTIAAAILAFSVTFRPTLTRVDYPWLMWGGWLALGVSVACGMLHMLLWSHFYLSHRDFDWHDLPAEGKARRKLITSWRRFVMFLQFLGFAGGVVGIGLFAALNFQNTGPLK
jgi:hypothetical protein